MVRTMMASVVVARLLEVEMLITATFQQDTW